MKYWLLGLELTKKLVRIANREDPDLGLTCLSRLLRKATFVRNFRTFTLVKDFRIIPEFRILRLNFQRIQDFEADFPKKVSLKILNEADSNSFFDYTPRKLCLWWGILFSRCPSVRLSVRLSVRASVRNVLFP